MELCRRGCVLVCLSPPVCVTHPNKSEQPPPPLRSSPQNRNWEIDQSTGAGCLPGGPAGPCALGNLPRLAVAAAGPEDVAAALRFAAARNVRVVVKATGHDYLGRSSAPDSLLVWLGGYKGVSFQDNFSACPATVAPTARAATVRAGVVWDEVSAALRGSPWAAVSGYSRSVGVAGGWLQGGGHSYMSPAHGLGVDRVLRAQCVLADGTVAEASPCSHPELFWALRGGGGGTFCVVTEVTYALVPAEPVVGAALAFAADAKGMRRVLDGLLRVRARAWALPSQWCWRRPDGPPTCRLTPPPSRRRHASPPRLADPPIILHSGRQRRGLERLRRPRSRRRGVPFRRAVRADGARLQRA